MQGGLEGGGLHSSLLMEHCFPSDLRHRKQLDVQFALSLPVPQVPHC